MATSPAVYETTPVKDIPKFPVLPPIEKVQQQLRDNVEQTTAAKEEIVEKIMRQKKLLRHRRSKIQQKQLHMILYVFPQLCFQYLS